MVANSRNQAPNPSNSGADRKATFRASWHRAAVLGTPRVRNRFQEGRWRWCECERETSFVLRQVFQALGLRPRGPHRLSWTQACLGALGPRRLLSVPTVRKQQQPRVALGWSAARCARPSLVAPTSCAR